MLEGRPDDPYRRGVRPPRASEHSARRHVPKQVRVPPVLDVASSGENTHSWTSSEVTRIRTQERSSSRTSAGASGYSVGRMQKGTPEPPTAARRCVRASSSSSSLLPRHICRIRDFWNAALVSYQQTQNTCGQLLPSIPKARVSRLLDERRIAANSHRPELRKPARHILNRHFGLEERPDLRRGRHGDGCLPDLARAWSMLHAPAPRLAM
jgi:hypothetical protein